MISFREFRNKYTGTNVDVPWANGNLAGECVSLVQRYINECYGLPLYRSNGVVYARGNGVDFGNTLINDGDAYEVSKPEYGDLIIWGGFDGYGHVGVSMGGNEVFDQTNGQRKTAQVRTNLPYAIQYVRVKGNRPSDNQSSNQSIKLGDMVLVVSGAKDYNGSNVSSVFYNTRHRIDELVGDRAVLDIGGKTTAFRLDALYKDKAPTPEKPKPSKPKYEDRTGQTLVIYPEHLQGNKDVDLLRRDGSKYPNGIGTSDGRQRRYKIVETVSDGFYKVAVPNADTSETYIEWRPGIGFFE